MVIFVLRYRHLRHAEADERNMLLRSVNSWFLNMDCGWLDSAPTSLDSLTCPCASLTSTVVNSAMHEGEYLTDLRLFGRP